MSTVIPILTNFDIVENGTISYRNPITPGFISIFIIVGLGHYSLLSIILFQLDRFLIKLL